MKTTITQLRNLIRETLEDLSGEDEKRSLWRKANSLQKRRSWLEKQIRWYEDYDRLGSYGDHPTWSEDEIAKFRGELEGIYNELSLLDARYGEL